MSNQLRVEVCVRGRLAGDLLALMGSLETRVAPRHTVVSLACHDSTDLVGVLRALERAGVEVDRVTTRG